MTVDRDTLPPGVELRDGGIETRQVIEIEIKTFVTEYQAEVLIDQYGNRYVAAFPASVTRPVQYGHSLKSLSVYLSQHQLIPYNRIQEMFRDCFGLSISQGSLVNFNKAASERLAFFEEEIKSELRSSQVLHADETGIQVKQDRAWLHVASTALATHLGVHESRGQVAMEDLGVLTGFSGILCHDHWSSYFNISDNHALCLAHLLRELQWVIDFKDHRWSSDMKEFLLDTYKEVTRVGGELDSSQQSDCISQYNEIIQRGHEECPINHSKTGRGKVKQPKERNLLNRMDKYQNDILCFTREREVPFTNNQAERDIRMAKVQKKISGCFQSLSGAQTFARIKGCLSTHMKRGGSPYFLLRDVFN